MEEQLQIVAVRKNVEAQYVEMMVPLYSWGCERKIKKALANLKGIYSVNVDFEQQKVTVWEFATNTTSSLSSRKRGKEHVFGTPKMTFASGIALAICSYVASIFVST